MKKIQAREQQERKKKPLILIVEDRLGPNNKSY